MKGIVVLGDATSHGGKVITAQSNYLVNGKPVACVGDKVTCPKSGHSTNAIVEGHPTMTVNGKPVAMHGHKTACGATLISSHNGDHGHS
ncbi:Zn-binding Pro-Ala-Ala-Arg (PAAR) domain-containing protein, incolved in TypeVI secretion [Kushneria avicenniae]|uniref:Zn-binding Pro-Ala-Ala-Arg (PAAR) domain-containing protein, incolved in TypeVI secretion n=1 Tax=Kushneria avicenniae TaxID=402385 RepID=A0A1I1KDF3_9GAMM|nr:PAAR domain-containing protein [Kushneria avicenniae]SFC58515.1 Zn-binding Pro-Ala-Ala-Arg (PAAR) domain-containing protein, incolved in TypeVI secretion [Kushneria avicenniae]